MRNLAPKDVLLHLIFRVLFLALDTALVRKASVRLDDLVRGDSGYALEAVDVLGEEHLEKALAGEEGDEGMRDGRVELSGVQFVCENVEGLGVFAEVGDVEDGFGVG